MTKDKQKKKPWSRYLVWILPILIGATFGFLVPEPLFPTATQNRTAVEGLLLYGSIFVGACAAFFLHIIVHEAGHLVFGLLTGYSYSSFRVGSFMWVKENGRLKMKRLSLAGTGGQCLMIPPESSDGTFPFALYLLGGPLANLLFGFIFLALYFSFQHVMHFPVFLLMFGVFNFLSFLLNGIPMKLALVSNDGHNALSFAKDPHALHAFCTQMKVVEQISNGVRLKDMPEAWFSVPPAEEMGNSMSAALGVFACSRMMDQHLFREADAFIDKLLELDSLAGLHRNLLICDKVYCTLIGEEWDDILHTMQDEQQKKFMKTMKKFPPVLRTEYSYALLFEDDLAKAERIMAEFERVARTYPYPCDIDSERELIEIANQIAAKE